MYKKRTNKFVEVEIEKEWYLLIEISNGEDEAVLQYWLRRERMGIMSYVVGLTKKMVIDTDKLDLADEDAVIKYSYELLRYQIYDYIEIYDEEFY